MTTESEADSRIQRLRQFLIHETVEYFFNFTYLAFFLVSFAWYRRLVLASYHIHYASYFMPLIESAILAKVIMLGDVLHIGRRFRNRSLGFVTVYRALTFSVLAVLFTLLEHIVEAVVRKKTIADAMTEIADKGIDELLASYMLIVVAFIPFFAMKEIERVFGAARVRELFLRGGGPVAGSDTH